MSRARCGLSLDCTVANEWSELRTNARATAVAQARADAQRARANVPDPAATLREQLDPDARRRAFEAWKAGLRARK